MVGKIYGSFRQLDLAEVRAIFQAKHDSGDNWMLVCHSDASAILIELEKRFYFGDRNEDFTIVAFTADDHAFAIVAMAKCFMSADQYSQVVRESAGLELNPARSLQAIAPPELIPLARGIGLVIFGDVELAMSE